ncbi:MAG TPA: PD-(D/E)XK nuclease family protein [Burkholderiaceae bacterium]|nr:PD-(D/E)XK nuclease family protein [Burkholderiaceae bacterium]
MNGEDGEALGPPAVLELAAFFNQLRPVMVDERPLLAEQLPAVFDTLRELSFGHAGPELPRAQFRVGQTSSLISWFGELRGPLTDCWDAGLFGNPWAAAALRRDEVRNASVLAWFLDPRGGHGCGDALLVSLLDRIRGRLPDFPERPSPRCTVAVEECPDGSRANRVDIQVDDPTFIVVVEVKIDAPEQPGQLERYCRIAAERACGRPWAVALLTPDGRLPVTAGEYGGYVVPFAWSMIATGLRRAGSSKGRTLEGRAPAGVSHFLATTFASHVTNF